MSLLPFFMLQTLLDLQIFMFSLFCDLVLKLTKPGSPVFLVMQNLVINTVVSCSRRLLQPVEGLVEPAHQLRVRKVNKTGGLIAVDHPGDCVVEECVLDVELVHRSNPEDSQS
jgi:hypothetical protein